MTNLGWLPMGMNMSTRSILMKSLTNIQKTRSKIKIILFVFITVMDQYVSISIFHLKIHSGNAKVLLYGLTWLSPEVRTPCFHYRDMGLILGQGTILHGAWFGWKRRKRLLFSSSFMIIFILLKQFFLVCVYVCTLAYGVQ